MRRRLLAGRLLKRGGLALLLACAGLLCSTWLVTPAFDAVRAGTAPSDRWLLDRNGELLHVQRVNDRVRRLEWTALADISPALRKAIVATEDRRFEQHPGVDPLAMAAVLRARVTGSGAPVRGASTLTMQLAGLLDPALTASGIRRSPWQKVRQIEAALRLGLYWNRPQVLEAYLNLVPFRGELQGVSAAARGLFDKSPSALDDAESWLLAALLARPNATPAAVAQRACRLAQRSADAVPCARLQALAADRLASPPGIRVQAALAPHVARMLFSGAQGQAGSGSAGAQPVLSTLDRDLQRFALDTLRAQLESIAGRNAHDGAVLVVDNASGEVLAYVGNSGERASARFVDGVQALRQAGSTLKPFLYQMAIEQRLLTAASLLDDSPVDLVAPNGLYVPKNYDRQFTGWVSLRTALAGSLNEPAVRTLMLVGADPFADRLRALGFADVKQSGEFYGYSLALGSAEVRLSQLVNAFRTVANGGLASPLTMVVPATAAHHLPARQRTMSEASAFIVADMLADRSAGVRTFGFASALSTRGWSAVKTGTSKDMRDNWCIGFSERYTVGVWVGNFDGAPMRDVSGVTGAAPVWQEVMNHLHRAAPSQAPHAPAGVQQVASHAQGAGQAQLEWFLDGTAMAQVERAGRGSGSRIVYPGAGVVVALDPDIPPSQQRLLLSAAPATSTLTWQLDGVALGSARQAVPWRPVPGRHRLRLIDAAGRPVDEVLFEVRGARREPTAQPAPAAGAADGRGASRVALSDVLFFQR